MPRGVYIRTEEHKKHISEARIGKCLTEEHRKNLSLSHKGQICWCKGKKLTEEHRKKLSESHKGITSAMKGKKLPEEWKKHLSESHKGYKYPPDREGYWKGKKFSESHKENISKGTKGNLKCGWNRGLTKYIDERVAKVAESFRGKHFSPGTEFKKGHNKGMKYSDERIKNCLRRRIPTSLENKFQSIINKHNLPYKYVGNGDFIIVGCNPDFINTNNEKIAIEVYARYYKLRNSVTIEEWKSERQKIFNEYGWDIIFFDETQVKEDYILGVLK